ncbi:MAG: methyltransferase domain-containing protein [Acidobacteriaceae bacterium]|nr:methyltransferase domain-containing protein [Acidobacteriaceae bacterium]
MSNSPPVISARQKAISCYFQSRRSFWKQAYEGQNLQSTIYQARMDLALQFFESLALRSDAKVLDAGCGAGILAVELARRGYQVHAIDPAHAMLDLTRQRADKAGVRDRVTTRSGDICALDFPDNSLDVVCALGVLPWVATAYEALMEVHRVLKPGAHFIATIDNKNRLSHRLDLLLPTRRLIGRFLRSLHLRDSTVSWSHTIKEIDASLSGAGFEKINCKTLGFGPFTLAGFRLVPDRIGRQLDRVLRNRSDSFAPLRTGGAQYVFLAKRVTH